MQKIVQVIANIWFVVVVAYALLFVTTFALFNGCLDAGYAANECADNAMYRAVMFWR